MKQRPLEQIASEAVLVAPSFPQLDPRAAALATADPTPAHELTPDHRLARAVEALERHDASYCARTGLWPRQRLWLLILGFGCAAALATNPAGARLAAEIVCTVAFALLLSIRVIAFAEALAPPQPGPSQKTAASCNTDMPVYSILIALHDEVAVVPQLVSALAALRYPLDKLDIIFALEASDTPTKRALEAQNLPSHMRVITVPEGLPRTKPRALTYALTFANGHFVAVYDAEDIPAPSQLRDVLAEFDAGGERLGCIQANLAIDNAHASWLTGQFTIEYAILFGAILPAAARYGLPLPLGGTSNHFRRTALDACGGWDPWNVTEDADLGLRLARCGWRVTTLPSVTWEEAPVRFGPWFQQRTRWYKGWLQTYFIHMRAPVRTWRELGPASWLWFQTMFGGSLLTAFAHLIFYALLAFDAAAGSMVPPPHGFHRWLWWISVATFAAAWLVSIATAVLTLHQQGRARLALPALVTPLYWIITSLAAYRALAEWIQNPFYWAKTPHGAARPKHPHNS